MHGYEVLKKLAEGSAAEAFLARQEGSQDRVIVEILRPELASNSQLIERFLHEAKARQNLEHPNVTRRVTTGRTSDGRLFVVTEPVEGENLSATLWSQGSLEEQDLIRIAVPLCDALEFLHRSGIVHGGVKPDNVYLSGGLEAHNPKLLDYGLAFFRGHGADLDQGRISQPEYLAPECLAGRQADARSDIYGMGVLMYEALTGFPPFTGTSARDVLYKQRTELPPLPASCERLARIVYRCLHPEPLDRYASAQELKQALSRELDGEADPAPRAPIPARNEEKPGDVLGAYELLHLIGEGAMGRVFSARHVRLGKKVALKLLRPEKARDRSPVERFFREARTANQINHANIVQIFDFIEEPLGSAGRRVYFVMELLEGISLGDLLRHEIPSIGRILHIARQLCTALEAAHALGVVHRDVKPDNVFLITRGGKPDFVKVLDFGVAKLAAAPDELPVVKTLTGAIVGTPAFMSPEQAAGLNTDPRTDVYAVGNVLYQALSGRLPFQANTYGQLLANIVTHPPPPLPELTPGGEVIPGVLRDLVMRCLAKEPERRPTSMRALREMIMRSEARTQLRQDPVTPILPHHRSRRRRDRRTTFLTLAMVSIAVIGAGWLSRKKPASVPRRSLAIAAPLARPRTDNPANPSTSSPSPSGTVRLEVTSEPPGARVLRSDSKEQIGTTPLSASVPRHDGELTLRLELIGYLPSEQTVRLDHDANVHANLRMSPSAAAKVRLRRKQRNERMSHDRVVDPFER